MTTAADLRDRNADERDRQADERDEATAVAAHDLLNSAAIVSMGIETLETHWLGMPGADRRRLLRRIQVHALSMDDRLRDMVQGRHNSQR